jgi:hypothetical protein
VFTEARKGQWVAVVEMERGEVQEARVRDQASEVRGEN